MDQSQFRTHFGRRDLQQINLKHVPYVYVYAYLNPIPLIINELVRTRRKSRDLDGTGSAYLGNGSVSQILLLQLHS